MDEKKKIHMNVLIMIAPMLLPAVIFLRILGESFIFFAVPLIVCICATALLAEKLSTKDAITYPLVQYPFLFLLLYLFESIPPGLGFILTLPVIFITNMSIGHIYFRHAKKKCFTKILLLLGTLFITVILYSDHLGRSALSIISAQIRYNFKNLVTFFAPIYM